MSRSTGYCRFPDGTIKYFLYDGTVSYVRANLYDSPEEAWEQKLNLVRAAKADYNVQEVQLAIDYGDGMSWEATADLGKMRILDRLQPFEEIEPEPGDCGFGYGSGSCSMHTPDDGLPVWVQEEIARLRAIPVANDSVKP